MAVKEISVADKLRQLYLLQSIDSKIDKIEVLKGELPMEVNDLEDEIEGLKTRINKISDSIADIDGEINNHKANIAEALALIERYERQLDNVKNNREYDALTKEIEMQKLEIQLSEKKIKEVTSIKTSKTEVLDSAKEKIESRQKDLETKKVELKEIIEKTEKEEAQLKKKSEKAKDKIEPRILKAYTKIRNTYRNGLAVARVERGACGGCFNLIPPQVQIEIGVQKNIVACEHCGRILVDDVIADEIDG
jgi:predicted  nucleic acid-binding Zn-ribbon protein